MTLGQRIAEQRKAHQLSQEALGEEMGVSRQAISKWESDAAIPEVDKLIALSRRFSVSVGWLLGVEEAPIPAEPEDGLTEGQLKLVEEIASHYLPPKPTQEQRRKQRERRIVAIGLAAALIAAAAIAIGGSLSRLEDQIWALQTDNTSLNQQLSELSSQISVMKDSIQMGVTESLEQQARILSDWSLSPSAISEDGVTIDFSATPKAFQEGDQGVLSVQLESQEAAQVNCQWTGTAYSASVELEPADGYRYYFTLTHSDGSQEFQALTEVDNCLYNIQESLTPDFYADTGCTMRGYGNVNVDGIRISYVPPILQPDDQSQLADYFEGVLLINGEETERERLDGSWSEYEFSAAWRPRFTLLDGDTAELRIVLHLNSGETLETTAETWTCEDGVVGFSQ